MVNRINPLSALLTLSLCLFVTACVEGKTAEESFCDAAPAPSASIFLDSDALKTVPFCEYTAHRQIHAFLASVPQSTSVAKILVSGDFSASFPTTLVFKGRAYDGAISYGEPDTIAYPFATTGELNHARGVVLFADDTATFDVRSFANRMKVCAINDPEKCARLQVLE